MTERQHNVVLSVRLAVLFHGLAKIAKSRGEDKMAEDFALQGLQTMTIGVSFMVM